MNGVPAIKINVII